MGGRFISFEGGEGSGKSTQLRRLAARLSAQDVTVITTREPGGTPGAEDIRQLLVEGEPGRWDGRVEALLVNAARADHVARLIRPALAEGKWVLCDRYVHSTLAYQGAARGLDEAELRQLHAFATGDLWPDLTIVLDVDPALGLARAAGRAGGEARFEGEPPAFHKAVRDRFLSFPEVTVIPSDASVDDVTGAVWSVVAERFGL
ncbi:dTMP kinase [Sphingosinicella sp.]|uniref:dTMP kinase n=1 Tax=Sphingosinicella sp. TaxID=1917971 RepID=UPI0017C7BF22|nr:dTMP kinase [Sphingosinicella sp.]MBA4757112.1 dTMP kinase [Sphingosinicella sp.]